MLRLIAGIVLLAMVLGGWLCRRQLRSFLRWVTYHSIETSEMWGLAETFWNEAAVLWFVFPLLNTLYERAKDKPPPSTKAVLGSFAVAIVFFSVALFCKKTEHRLAEAEKEMQERRT